VKKIRNITENAFVVETFDKMTLEDTGIKNCGTVIICIGDSIDVGVLTTLNVISLEVPRVIARAMSYEEGLVLEKIGAEVIYPERDMAVRLANRLTNANILDTIQLYGDIDVSELKLTAKIAGQTIEQINLRQKYKLNIIAIEHNGDTTTEIDPQCSLHENDSIVVVGKRENIRKYESFLSME
jgi:trk system potassium uptake protein TrkA